MPSANIVTDYSAPTNGTSDSTPAFMSFRTWARAQSGLITLTIPAHTYVFTTNDTQYGGNPRLADGIGNLLVLGTGATLSDAGGFGINLSAGGLVQDNLHSARTATAQAGATSVSLLDVTKASLFTVGQWALVTGYDLQGAFSTPYGFPPNPHFFDYVLVSGVSGGTISFTTTPLTNTYKSTWPNWNSGSAFEIDNGGPATIYAVPAAWDSTLEFRGLTLTQPTNQVLANARSAIFNGVTVTGAGLIPSQNRYFEMTNCDQSANMNIEVDKIVKDLVIDGGTFYQIKFQSSSVDTLTMRNGATITSSLVGTPKRTYIDSSCSILDFRSGAYAYGRSDSVSVANSTLTSMTYAGILVGISNRATMTNSIISFPKGSLITGTANNGSGLVRLTVNSTAGFVTGKLMDVSNVAGTTEANGSWIITVIDSTHVDLQGTTFVHAFSSSTGIIHAGSALGICWAVPGTKCFWCGAQAVERSFIVLDVTEDTNSVYIQTTWPGGFPTVPLNGGLLSIRTHPCPIWSGSNLSGSADALDYAQSGANGRPLYSYSKRSYTGNTLVTPAAMEVWGRIKNINVVVSQAYTGTGVLSLGLFGQFKARALDPDNSVTNWNPIVDLKVVGTRSYTYGLGWTGTQTNDVLVDPGDLWFGGPQVPFCSTNVSGQNSSVWPIVSIEVITEEGFAQNARGLSRWRNL